MKKLLALIIISIFLVGCNNGNYNKVMEVANSELASGEFDKALTSFKLALDEKPNDEEAKKSYENLVAYNQVKQAIEDAKWEDAIRKANNLLEKDKLVSSMINELKQYVEIAEANKEQHEIALEKIEQLKKLLSEKKYGDAEKFISELKQDVSIKEGLKTFTEELNIIESTLNEEIKKQKEVEELEAKKIAEAKVSSSKKSEYIQKLNNIEKGLEELKHLYDGPTSGMIEAALETYKRWDDALNDIYGVLKKQLSPNEMSSLREKQIKWIKYRDDKAKTDSLKYEGGTLEGLEYRLSLAETTKKRCYELVEVYMK